MPPSSSSEAADLHFNFVDLERCYALYKILVNARIQWWIKQKVNGLEDCNYEDHVRRLDAIQ